MKVCQSVYESWRNLSSCFITTMQRLTKKWNILILLEMKVIILWLKNATLLLHFILHYKLLNLHGLSFRFQNLTACGEKNIGPLAKQWYHTHLQLMQVQRLFFHTATKFATRWTKPIITRGIKFIRKIEHRGEDCYGIYLKPSILKGNVKKFQNCVQFSLDSRFSIFAYRFHL